MNNELDKSSPTVNPARRTRAVAGEVVTETDIVDIAYERTGLDELVQRYAFHEGGYNLTAEIEVALADLAAELSRLAVQGDNIDVDLIRHGFDRLYADMNRHAAVARGLRLPAGSIGRLLEKSGIRQPRYRQVVVPLDDKYWNEQFLAQFHEGRMVKPLPDEPREAYLARYTAHCLKGFPWAYFTYSV